MMSATQKPMKDGGWGWAIVGAVFIIHMITHGLIYSFGLLFISLEDRFKGSKAEIAWVGSLVSGTMYLGGPVAGYFSTRFGHTPVVVVGALVAFLGYALSLLVTNLYVLYLTMGILTGVGFSFLYQPAVVCVTLAFRKHLTIACGIASCGCGVGAFVFSSLINYLLETYSWYGTVLISAGIILNCIPCGLVLRSFRRSTGGRNRKDDSKKGHNTREESFCDHEKLMYTHIEKTKLANTYTLCEMQPVDKYKHKQYLVEGNNATEHAKCLVPSNTDIHIEREPFHDNIDADTMETDGDMCSSLFSTCGIEIVKNPVFMLYATSQFMFFAGQYIPFIYLPGYLNTIGIKGGMAVWVISAIGISSILGRILLGYLADKTKVNRTRMFALVLLVGGMMTLFLRFYFSIPVLLIYALVYGICLGTGVTLISVVLIDLLGTAGLNEAFGMTNLFCGFGTLLGPPIAGILFDTTNDYSATFITSGAAFVIGSGCLFLATAFQAKNKYGK